MKRAWFVAGLVSVLAARAQARPDDGADLFSFEPGDVIETYDSARVRVHFTRAGVHSVPAADANTDGVPDHVATVADNYEAALDRYAELGFRAPLGDDDVAGNNGGDGRFDVYLVDFGLAADGAFRVDGCAGSVCAGHMVQENDFQGYGYPSVSYANRLVSSHELFHAVQAAYDNGQGTAFSEGTAVWASEQFDASLFDLEGFGGRYLEEASDPIDSGGAGPVDSFVYGTGLFYQYLSERFGVDVVVALMDATVDGAGGVADPYWLDVIDGVLQAAAEVGFADAFAEFALWTLYTDERADPDASFAGGEDIPARPFELTSLPVEESALRVFRASSRVFDFSVVGRSGEHHARLVATDAQKLEGQELVLFTLDGRRVDAVVAGAAVESGLDGVIGWGGAIDVTGKDALGVLVVNTRTAGDAPRPGLCVGTLDEVNACTAALFPVEPGPEPDEPDPSEPGSCAGCAAADPTLGAGLLALLLARRRRQRPSRTTPI